MLVNRPLLKTLWNVGPLQSVTDTIATLILLSTIVIGIATIDFPVFLAWG